jgi:hypothetical protein
MSTFTPDEKLVKCIEISGENIVDLQQKWVEYFRSNGHVASLIRSRKVTDEIFAAEVPGKSAEKYSCTSDVITLIMFEDNIFIVLLRPTGLRSVGGSTSTCGEVVSEDKKTVLFHTKRALSEEGGWKCTDHVLKAKSVVFRTEKTELKGYRTFAIVMLDLNDAEVFASFQKACDNRVQIFKKNAEFNIKNHPDKCTEANPFPGGFGLNEFGEKSAYQLMLLEDYIDCLDQLGCEIKEGKTTQKAPIDVMTVDVQTGKSATTKLCRGKDMRIIMKSLASETHIVEFLKYIAIK